VLKATCVVLVEHMDEAAREALIPPDPDAAPGPPRESWEYIDQRFSSGPVVIRPDCSPRMTPDVSQTGRR
jgi:hypothetical protein